MLTALHVWRSVRFDTVFLFERSQLFSRAWSGLIRFKKQRRFHASTVVDGIGIVNRQLKASFPECVPSNMVENWQLFGRKVKTLGEWLQRRTPMLLEIAAASLALFNPMDGLNLSHSESCLGSPLPKNLARYS